MSGTTEDLDKLLIIDFFVMFNYTVANSPGFTGRLPGFGYFSQIPHGFEIVTDFSRILKR